MKLVLARKYYTKLKNWDIDCIKEVENICGKISTSIYLWMQKLLNNIPDQSALLSQPALSFNNTIFFDDN